MDIQRQNIINSILNQGGRSSDIDRALTLHGYVNQYNPLTNIENYKNILHNSVRNAEELAKGYKTISGQAVNTINRNARKAINIIKSDPDKVRAVQEVFNRGVAKAQRNMPAIKRTISGGLIGTGIGALTPVGIVGGGILGLEAGSMGAKNLANAMLATYNTNLHDIKTGKVDWRDVAQGAMDRPVSTTFDITSLGGGKAIAKGVKSIPEESIVRKILPSENQKAVNRLLTQSGLSSSLESSKNYRGVKELYNRPLANREGIVKYITTDDATGLNQTDRVIGRGIRRDLKNVERTAIKNNWIDPTESRNNVVSQYVIHKLGDAYPDLLHNNLMTHLSTGEDMIKDSNILKTIEEGKNKYDANKISFLTQKLVPSQDLVNNIRANDFVNGDNYWNTERFIGRTSPKKLANRLEDSVNFQLKQIEDANKFKTSTMNLLNNYGRPITNKAEFIKPNETLVSADAVDRLINNNYNAGGFSDLVKQLSKPKSGDSLYAVNKDYLKALQNSLYTPQGMGRKALSMWKKNVLASPRWFNMNRMGNIPNNFIEGITPSDYKDAIKYKSLIPESLRQQTSFANYIEDTSSLAKGAKGKLSPIGRIGKDITSTGLGTKVGVSKLISGGKQLLGGDIKGGLTSLEGINDIFSNPIFRLESGAETMDRWANMIRQTKRIAKSTGESIPSLLKKLSTDEGLYNKVNTEVNKSLGDYTGKNYFLNPTLYKTLDPLVPFWRFISQTARTTGRQLNRNPLAFNAMIMLPNRAGEQLNRQVVSDLNLDPEKYTGGFPYNVTPQQVRTVGMDVVPINNILEEYSNIVNMKHPFGITNPLINNMVDLSTFTKMGRPIMSPEKLQQLQSGMITNQDKYEPSTKEKYDYAREILLQNLLTPYRQATTWAGNLGSYLMGQPSHSGFDTSLLKENPNSYLKSGAMELVGPMVGISSQSQVRADRPMSIKEQKQRVKAMAKFNANLERKQLYGY